MGDLGFVDLYDTLGVGPQATAEQIRAAVKTTRRTWVLRQNAPSLERRQEAETVLARVAEAERVLLDPHLRVRFDKELHDQTQAARTDPPPAAAANWLEAARTALEGGDPSRAAWAAREATHASPQDPEAWALRGRADLDLGRLDDATYELEQASALEPRSAYRHYEVGWALQSRKRFGPALSEYATATELDPDEPLYPGGDRSGAHRHRTRRPGNRDSRALGVGFSRGRVHPAVTGVGPLPSRSRPVAAGTRRVQAVLDERSSRRILGQMAIRPDPAI